MLSLLRADFYKLVRKKSFYVCSVLAAILAVLGIFVFDNFVLAPYLNQGFTKEMLHVSAFVAIPQGITVAGIFCTILSTLIVTEEFSFGTIKNMVSSGKSRLNIYLSKLILSFSIVIILTLVCLISSFLTGLYLWGFGEVSREEYLSLLKMVGLVILSGISLQSIYVMVAFLARNTATAISASMLLAYLYQSICRFLSFFTYKIFNVSTIDFARYWPGTYYSQIFVSMQISQEDLTLGLAVCGLSIAISCFIGILTFSKRDIK